MIISLELMLLNLFLELNHHHSDETEIIQMQAEAILKDLIACCVHGVKFKKETTER